MSRKKTPPTQPSLFDLGASRKARDSGIGRTVSNNPTFSAEVRAYVIALSVGWVGIAEDVRRVWNGIQPRSPHAWGGVFSGLVKAGYLEKTGRRPPMNAIKSHARATDEYRRTDKLRGQP